jgi:hypothetical protein
MQKFFAIAVMLCLGGCVAMPVDTPSGRPEVTIPNDNMVAFRARLIDQLGSQGAFIASANTEALEFGDVPYRAETGVPVKLGMVISIARGGETTRVFAAWRGTSFNPVTRTNSLVTLDAFSSRQQAQAILEKAAGLD